MSYKLSCVFNQAIFAIIWLIECILKSALKMPFAAVIKIVYENK